MKDYHTNVFYSEEDEGYIADIADLKYCFAFGETPEEAVREVLIAKAAWLETAKAENKQFRYLDIDQLYTKWEHKIMFYASR